MRPRTWLGLLALLALMGFCRIQETTRCIGLRNQLARHQQWESKFEQRLEDLLSEEMRLLRPPRLLALNQELNRPLTPLRPWSSLQAAHRPPQHEE